MINDESLTSNLIGKIQKNHFDKLLRKNIPPSVFWGFCIEFREMRREIQKV
jgi:hypothetical protein